MTRNISMQPCALITNDLIIITMLILIRALSSQADGEAAAAHSHFRVLAVCLGISCVLLVASISAIIYSEFHFDKLSTNKSTIVAAYTHLDQHSQT